MKNHQLFITGTDTNIGKTFVTQLLLHHLKQAGFKTIGLKPLATGGQFIKNKMVNEDALTLIKASSIQLGYDDINPFLFEPAIAPHIAAHQVNCSLSIAGLDSAIDYALNYPADFHIIEGVGGWYVPLNAYETMADFVLQKKLPIILVVGVQLGCLNHALLSYEAIRQKTDLWVGWIANVLQTECHQENIDYLQSKIPKLLGIIPYKSKLHHDISPITKNILAYFNMT